MGRPPLADRAVHVIGIGLHRYRPRSDATYAHLGLTAVGAALADAGIAWPEVEAAYVGTASSGVAAGRPLLSRLGATGLAIQQVENASASGSTAVALAALDVASGRSDVALALGVDQPRVGGGGLGPAGPGAGIPDPHSDGDLVVPVTHFALMAARYLDEHGATPEQLARVAVKNHANGARNPFAQRQRVRTMDEVMADPIAGVLTRLQCCPVGEGAAAALLASSDAVARLGLDPARCPRVVASVTRSQGLTPADDDVDVALTAATAAVALDEAGVRPEAIDVLEVHDAFSIEELRYAEAVGLCRPGRAPALLEAGAFDIGGRCAVSPSGGLLAMGHPIGPTGVGQVCELTRQLRGEAGDRQQPGARTGVAHMVGLGAVCVVHVLQRAA